MAEMRKNPQHVKKFPGVGDANREIRNVLISGKGLL